MSEPINIRKIIEELIAGRMRVPNFQRGFVWDPERVAYLMDSIYKGYTDWQDGEFVSPSERITAEMLQQIIERNETFLGYAHNSLKMLKRFDKSPEDLQDLMVEFIAQAKKMRAEKPDDLMAASNELIQRFLDAGLKRLKDKPD